MRSIDNHPTSSINGHPISSIDPNPIASIDTHEEADGFHKRVKRIHDPVKFVVPCAVFEVESPIPPDRSVCLGSYSGVFDDHIHPEASQRGLIFRSEVDTDTTELVSNDINTPRSIDTTTSPSIDTTAASSIDCGRISE
ncbi:hypothetical protein F2Q69_00021799 [Brassica cretica]|uniref:Uncharacterized protein n=1 Tax=Brassica cretica TaxID=69181 RepID=A0A8S9Q5N1_BRACR|nr:hypothetical protein F2Q69_00021799 [Brassica cretica]